MQDSALVDDIKKYLAYIFETRGFTSDLATGEINAAVMEIAASARGANHGPAIMVHGIMPRSGTVYAGELLRRHPDLYAYPYQLWEFPALQVAGEVRRLQHKFLLGYKLNRAKIGPDDFLPLFGASMMAYLHGPVPPGRRALVKMPSVQYLTQFYAMFPHENLLILLRDGRDVVHSTLRTWRYLNFPQVCLRWNRSARVILSTCEQLRRDRQGGFWMARYEEALDQPEKFIREACRQFGLDEHCYPYEQIANIRVIGSSHLEEEKKVGWRHLQRPKNFRPTEYWRDWSAARKLIFKIIAGRSLMQLGYCDNLNW